MASDNGPVRTTCSAETSDRCPAPEVRLGATPATDQCGDKPVASVVAHNLEPCGDGLPSDSTMVLRGVGSAMKAL